jgi:zinc protease
MRLNVRAGSVFDSDQHAGLASVTTAMLRRGTTRRTFQQLNEETESVGMSLSADAGRFLAELSLRCLSDDLDLGIDVLSDVLLHPTFPGAELEKLRGQVLTYLRRADDDTGAVADRTFRELAYPGGHPFRRRTVGYTETVQAIGRDDLAAFHRAMYHPDGAVLTVVGAVRFGDVVERLERALAGWPPTRKPNPLAVPPAPVQAHEERPTREVELKGKLQCDVVMGLPGIPRPHPDYYALAMANLILGRLGLMGRLGANVRDSMGLAYHISSSLEGGLGPGAWAIHAGVNPANVQRAIAGALEEVERMRREPVTDGELHGGQTFSTGVMALRLETSDGIASMLQEIEIFQLGLDYVDRYPEIIRSLTKDDLLAAFQRHIVPEAFALAIAGPTPRKE